MSELHESPSYDELGSDYLQSVDQFDTTRGHYYDWLAEIAVTLPQDYRKISNLQINKVANCFTRAAMQSITAESDENLAKYDIAHLWKQDDSERVELFANTTNQTVFSAISTEDMESVVDHLFTNSDTAQELVNNIHEVYRCYLSSDVATYLGFMEQMHGVTDQASTEKHIQLLEIDIKKAKRAASIGAAMLGLTVALRLAYRVGRNQS